MAKRNYKKIFSFFDETLENIKEQMEDFIKTSNNEFYIDKMTNTLNRNKYELDIKNKFDKQRKVIYK